VIMTLSTVGILAKPRSHNSVFAQQTTGKCRCSPSFANKGAILLTHRVPASVGLSLILPNELLTKSTYSGTVSLSTRQYRPSFRSGDEQTSIICSARALGLINSIKLTVSTGDPVASASKTIEHGRVRHATDCLIAGLEDCLDCESLQILLYLELPPVRRGAT
jgi:hypothetical protein